MSAVLDNTSFNRQVKRSYYYPRNALNYSLSEKGRLKLHSDLNYEVKQTDRGGALQIHHLSLLKPWREVVPVSLVCGGSQGGGFGTRGESKTCGSIYPSPLWRPPLPTTKDRSRQVREFSDVFLPLPGHINLTAHHSEIPWGVVVCKPLLFDTLCLGRI